MTERLSTIKKENIRHGNSLGVQWLRIRTVPTEDVGSIPDWGAKISQAMEQLSLCTTTTEPLLHSPGATTTEPTSYLFRTISQLSERLFPGPESLSKTLKRFNSQHLNCAVYFSS